MDDLYCNQSFYLVICELVFTATLPTKALEEREDAVDKA